MGFQHSYSILRAILIFLKKDVNVYLQSTPRVY